MVGGWSRYRSMVGCGRGSVALSGDTLDVVLVVAGSEIFIEESSVSTVVGVLLTILVAVVVNLTSSLLICIMPA